MLPYLALLLAGFTELPRSPGALVRSYRTFSPLPGPTRRLAAADPCAAQAVCFLWHFPSRCRDWALPSAMPFGVRTFLPPLAQAATVFSKIGRAHV